eukprot:Gb_23590 [translate_table: standard]
MAINISAKVAWVRTHPIVSLAVSCSSLLLLIPRVLSIVVFFWPLLVSTGLFVTALLTVGNAHLEEGQHQQVDVLCHEELGESSFQHGEEALNGDRSLLECVKEQHEGGRVLFDSMFEDQQQPTTLVNHTEITHKGLSEKERDGIKPMVNDGEEIREEDHRDPIKAKSQDQTSIKPEQAVADIAKAVENESGEKVSEAENLSEITPAEEPAGSCPGHQEGVAKDPELL